MMKLFAAAAALSAYVAATPIDLQDQPTGSQVTIQDSTYSGSGCPQGSVSTILSEDHTAITLGFDSFQVFIGPNVKPQDKSKNCAIHLGIRYPGGFQLSVVDATFHGYARLDDGVTASLYTTYFFSHAASKTANSRSELRGSQYRNGKMYDKTDVIEMASTVWSPCGSNGLLNVNNRIALVSSNNNAQGELSTDDATIKFSQKLAVQWRRCDERRSAYVDGTVVEFGDFNSTVSDMA